MLFVFINKKKKINDKDDVNDKIIEMVIFLRKILK